MSFLHQIRQWFRDLTAARKLRRRLTDRNQEIARLQSELATLRAMVDDFDTAATLVDLLRDDAFTRHLPSEIQQAMAVEVLERYGLIDPPQENPTHA